MDYKKFRKAENLVEKEVLANASWLIQEHSQNEKYLDEILEVSVRYPDPEDEDIDPDPIEALEHWIVTKYMGEQLQKRGEMVIFDFLGFTIWGRACTGQAIAADSVIQEIATE